MGIRGPALAALGVCAAAAAFFLWVRPDSPPSPVDDGEPRSASLSEPQGGVEPSGKEGDRPDPIEPSLFQGEGGLPSDDDVPEATRESEGEAVRTFLRCRIVDLAGHPIADASVRVAVEAPSWSRQTLETSDGEGLLRFPLRSPPWQPGMNRRIDLQLMEREIAVAEARIDGRREFPDGENDLGTIALLPLPRLVSGIVVDEDGEPRPGAQVQLLWRSVGDRHLQPMEGWDFSGVPPQSSRADGTFDLRGHLEPGDLLLMVHHSVYLPDTAGPLNFGATGVVATLKRSFSFRGRLLLPEGAPPEQLKVRLAKDPPAPATYSVSPNSDGEFQVPWMSRGTGRLDVSLARMFPGDAPAPEPFDVPTLFIESLEAVAIEPPGSGSGELLTIDLRNRLSVIGIEVRAGDPALEIVEGNVTVTDPQGARGTFEIHRGKCVVVARELPLSLNVSIPGFLDKTVDGVGGDILIALDPGLRLDVRVVMQGRLPDGARELDVRAIVAGGDIPRIADRALCDEFLVAGLVIGNPGPLTLQASVSIPGRHGTVRTDLGDSVAVQLAPGQPLHLVDLPIGAADLELLRKRIDSRLPPR